LELPSGPAGWIATFAGPPADANYHAFRTSEGGKWMQMLQEVVLSKCLQTKAIPPW